MTIQHNIITDPDLHEPKGASSASSGRVYIADGAGSGNWSYPLTGLDSASSGQVFFSNGSGSGTWAYPPAKAHGEIYITAGSTAHTLAVTSGYSLLNPASAWTASGNEDILTVTPGSGYITLTEAGHYFVSFYITFTTAAIANGSQYFFKYALNGTPGTRKMFIGKPTNGVDTIHISSSGTLSATAGQQLSIHAAGDGTSSTTNIIPVEAGLTAIHLD